MNAPVFSRVQFSTVTVVAKASTSLFEPGLLTPARLQHAGVVDGGEVRHAQYPSPSSWSRAASSSRAFSRVSSSFRL